MTAVTQDRKRSGIPAPLLLSLAVAGLALPSAVLAFSSRFEPSAVETAVPGELGSYTPASVDARLARDISVGSHLGSNKGGFRFTPAASTGRPDRSVTVAVRVDQDSARAITVRNTALAAAATTGAAPVRIAPTAYNLGVSRGFKSFAGNLSLGSDIRKIDMPDLATFKPGGEAGTGPARFSPRIALDDKEKAGRAPRTLQSGEQSVDVGGSYRLTRNLNVTAGVRYQQERDRLTPLTDQKQDSQAVYVGTQFRF